MNNSHESVAGQVGSLTNGSETAVSLAARALDKARVMADLNAFVALDEDAVMSQAKAARARRDAGRPLSPIDGIPIAVKDNFFTAGFPTTACSRTGVVDDGTRDARLVANLRRAGAVIFGKTNMHEWAYGATNSTSSFGPTANPCDRTRITGGSSGGSAAAVAGGIVGAALGSDTGGSIRIPAAACGVYGFKPTYGRASRDGILALSWSLDAPGPITREFADLELLLPHLLGSDPSDPATFGALKARAVTAPAAEPRLLALCGPGLERSDEVDAEVTWALSRSGMSVSTEQLSQLSSYFAAWEAIMHCEATAFHKQRLSEMPEAFDPVTRAHLEAGRFLTAEEYLHAQSIRASFTTRLLNGLGEWDALVLPTLPVVAPRQDESWQEFGGRRITTQDSMTWFCWMGNLAGLPSISIPVPVPGLPVGMMLMGRPGRDEELLAIAKMIDMRLRGAELQ
ncbi:amidase [Pseudorhizobium halotolerans]|jgi:Asp-tRNAAsn/Glu-tRNAGln amidotransferase A subunit and related amidases|uniref:Indoleacetamide hydrolase n=1 Tax=Pseudorhizobium halotolerans TaxID=1233081 RepID=A0ABM8PTE0_9HYPH|nr:amidase [Pseudorhizobium halotolerans]CAD7047547.1 amidase [Pseudorhizobium halotolerans]